MMKKLNKEGSDLLNQQNVVLPLWPTKKTFEKWLNDEDVVIIDTRPFQSYAQCHIPGTVNIPYGSSFTNWIGWLVDYEQQVYLITEQKHIQDLLQAFYSIGLDTVKGYMPPSIITQLNREGLKADKYAQGTPKEMAEQIVNGTVHVLDVRNRIEYTSGTIPGAQHVMLGYLPDKWQDIPTDKPIVVLCRSGLRAGIAASILKAKGIQQIIHLTGAYQAWVSENLPTTAKK